MYFSKSNNFIFIYICIFQGSDNNNNASNSASETQHIETDKDVKKYQKLIAKGETIEIPENLIKEIPYIETLLSGRFNVSEEGGIVKSEEIDPSSLKIILKYLNKKKLYILLASLPKENDVLQLFELFRFLSVKPPICIKKDSIKTRLLEPPSIGLSSQQDLVEYAFSIFYAYNLFNYRHENKIRNNIYNTIIFIYEGNQSSFRPRAKFHLLQLAKKCVHFSYNQFQKIKTFKVTDNLEYSDCESISSIESKDDFDDFYENMSYDSDIDFDFDNVIPAMFRHGFFDDGYENWHDDFANNFFYSDGDSDDY